MLKRRFSVLHLLLAALAAALLTGGGLALALYLGAGSEGLAILQGAALVRQRFAGEYDPEGAAEGALDGLVDSLGDRWSHYLTAQEYQDQVQTRSNAYVGVGITVNREDPEGLYVVAVEPEGPAARAGILPGELITAVDGRSAAGEGQQRAVDAMAGEEGTRVELTVRAPSGGERGVTLTRAHIRTAPGSWEMLEGGVGLITIRNFYTDAAQTFREGVEALTEQGARALVLDVRNDPGGYVDELTEMLDLLLPEGVIFRATDWRGNTTQVESDPACVELPMAVLVNADSYSAAELFAAQLQESAGAAIVGEQTCGKGYSQQTFPLSNGGALLLSTAANTTGGGVSLVERGVELDVPAALGEEQARLLLSGMLEPEQDSQLQAALAWLEGAEERQG